MKVEDHWDAYREYRASVFSWAIDIRGLKRSQRTVGLNVSRALIELLSVLLHERRCVDAGFQLNHRWFKSSSVADRLPDFEGKGEVVPAMVELENLAEVLTYGGPKPEERITEAIERFNNIEERLLVLIHGNE